MRGRKKPVDMASTRIVANELQEKSRNCVIKHVGQKNFTLERPGSSQPQQKWNYQQNCRGFVELRGMEFHTQRHTGQIMSHFGGEGHA